MEIHKTFVSLTILTFLFTSVVFLPDRVFGHCDTLNGPVVKAAQKALETGNVNRVMIWVQKKDETEIKNAFQRALSVRKLSPEAKDLSDLYFFETVVRIHRAGEGAPYTGLKPADTDLGPAIPCSDRALDEGKVEPVIKLITDTAKDGLQEHFKQVLAKKNFGVDDVDAGREYVEAYVTYTHYVERLYEAAKAPVEGHFRESGEGAGH